jgi:hypothetical protein
MKKISKINKIGGNSRVSKFLQVFLATTIVWLVYKFSLYIANRDALIQPNEQRKLNKYIIMGKKALGNYAKKVFDPNNELSKNYRNMQKSINVHPGAQFTYRFWMMLPSNLTDDEVKHKTIFVKGVPQCYLSNFKGDLGKDCNGKYLINCPSLRFGNTRNEMILMFNSVKNPYNEIKISNLQTIFNKWFLMTIVCSENVDENDNHVSGFKMSVFLNDKEVTSRSYENDTIYQNNGLLYFQPYGNIRGYIADFKYHNYALSLSDIIDDIKNKFNNKEITSKDEENEFAYPPYYNKDNILSLTDEQKEVKLN